MDEVGVRVRVGLRVRVRSVEQHAAHGAHAELGAQLRRAEARLVRVRVRLRVS